MVPVTWKLTLVQSYAVQNLLKHAHSIVLSNVYMTIILSHDKDILAIMLSGQNDLKIPKIRFVNLTLLT